MRLDEIMWNATIEHLYDYGIPGDLLLLLEQSLRAKNWRGRDLYRRYYNAPISFHSTFLEWYNEASGKWEFSLGKDENGQECEYIWKMSSCFPALIVSECGFYVYNFDV